MCIRDRQDDHQYRHPGAVDAGLSVVALEGEALLEGYGTYKDASDKALSLITHLDVYKRQAVTRFMHWAKTHAKEGYTEMRAADVLEGFRKEQEGYMYPSFETIAGYGPHGAIVHYSATPETVSYTHLCSHTVSVISSVLKK